MTLAQFNGLLWFSAALLPLAFLQRFLHRELQAVLLILSRSPQLTITLFSIIFLPGVLLHELSHYLFAVLLGVRTARFSLIPQVLPEGRLQLGFVETTPTDIVRDSIIGAAPLFAGGCFVALAALYPLHLLPMWDVLRNGQYPLFWLGLTLLPQIRDFPLWFYLAFVVSSTMLPSPSDRHAWLPLAVTVICLVALAILAGIGPWMLANAAPPLNTFFSAAAVILGLSAAVHAVLLVPLAITHFVLASITGVDVR